MQVNVTRHDVLEGFLYFPADTIWQTCATMLYNGAYESHSFRDNEVSVRLLVPFAKPFLLLISQR